MRKNQMVRWFRRGLLALFALLITVAAYLHNINGGGVSPSIHALCPYGGLESLYQVFTTGGFVSKIFTGTMTLFVITLLMAILFRRSFCGLICPFGALQELFAILGQKVFKRKMVLPSIIDKPLRYLKYLVLVVTIVFAWKTAGLWMAPYDPWSAYAHLPEGLESVWKSSAVGLMVLVITGLGSLLYDRFFCKYLCPMGALYGIVGKSSPLRVLRNDRECIHCGKCSKNCPMNIDVQNQQEIKSAECINCQTCVLGCPKTNVISTAAGRRTMKPFYLILLAMIVFWGSIVTAQTVGLYTLTPTTQKTGESLNYTEVKGYMSIKEAAELTKTELKVFYGKFEIPETVPEDTKMKEISKFSPEYDFDRVKESLGTSQ